MKTRFLPAVSLILAVSFVLVGCSGSSEPEVDKNVPMGKESDQFKPTSVKGAAGGGGPQGGKLGTPASQ